jgi:hypothetical protein
MRVTWTERTNSLKEQNHEGLKKLIDFHSKVPASLSLPPGL